MEDAFYCAHLRHLRTSATTTSKGESKIQADDSTNSEKCSFSKIVALPNRVFKMAANEPIFRDQSSALCKRLSHNESIKWISGPVLLQSGDGDLRKRQVADG
jgi:hypothetical protein